MSIYSKLRTPKFDVEVAYKDSDDFVTLPPQLLRLIEKIEIIETLGDLCKSTCVATLTFREGSREPYVHEGNLTSDNVYGLDHIYSNTTGMLSDLIFDFTSKNSSGIQFKTDVSVGDSSSIPLNNMIVTQELGINESLSAGENIAFEDLPKTVKNGPYVFENGNNLRITWGYLESWEDKAIFNQSYPITHTRTICVKMNVVQASFPDSGHPTLTISGTGGSSILEQYSPVIPQVFYTKGSTGEYKGMTTQEICDKIQKVTGIVIKVSEDVLYPELNPGYAEVWTKGQTLLDFLRKLARRHFAYLDVRTDPETKKITVHIINRKDYDKIELKHDINLFRYKYPGSIIKTIDVKADYSNPSGASISSINADGTINTSVDPGAVAVKITEPGSNLINSDLADKSKQVQQQLNTISQGKSHLISEMTPDTELANNKARATTRAGCMDSSIVALEFTTIGLPALRPTVIRFGGIGKRYSGRYRIQVITHIIDSAGYVCRGTATSNLEYGTTDSGSGSSKANGLLPESETIQMAEKDDSLVKIDNPGDVGKQSITGTSDTLSEEFNKFLIG